uniref:Uncharacterized protein n=1 Tax=viral metagenome TaxID=1070528 RepID=A0A6C0HRN8_9ZZZZ
MSGSDDDWVPPTYSGPRMTIAEARAHQAAELRERTINATRQYTGSREAAIRGVDEANQLYREMQQMRVLLEGIQLRLRKFPQKKKCSFPKTKTRHGGKHSNRVKSKKIKRQF